MQLIIIIKMIHLQGVNVDGDISGSEADIRKKKKKKPNKYLYSINKFSTKRNKQKNTK